MPYAIRVVKAHEVQYACCRFSMGKAMKRAAIYLRVSTQDQTTSNQEHELRQAAERAGWQGAKVYKDHGISGAKGRNGRPAFDALCRDATKRQFDVVMTWNVDRLGRSLKDLVAFLSELHALGIDLFLHQQGLDTTTPAGKAMFQMLGVFAEFERSIIQERVRAGLQRAKREGKRLGRPPIADKLAERIRAALAGGMSVRKTAAKSEVKPSTVQRIARPLAFGLLEGLTGHPPSRLDALGRPPAASCELPLTGHRKRSQSHHAPIVSHGGSSGRGTPNHR